MIDRHGMPYRKGGIGGVLLAVVFVALVALVVVGFTRGWFQVRATEEDSDRLELEMTVDRQRIRDDSRRATTELRELGQAADVAADLRSVEGTIAQRDEEAGTLVLETSNGRQTFRLADHTELESPEGQGQHAVLRAGRTAIVTYLDTRRDADAIPVAEKVVVREDDDS